MSASALDSTVLPLTRTSYAARQSFYLRVSPTTVLQVIMYVDSRDVRWMNTSASLGTRYPADTYVAETRTGDLMLRLALAVLKRTLMNKLQREAGTPSLKSGVRDRLAIWSGKEAVDVHSDVDFRMAYYFKRTGHGHAVLLKEKRMTYPWIQQQPAPAAAREKRAAPRQLHAEESNDATQPYDVDTHVSKRSRVTEEPRIKPDPDAQPASQQEQQDDAIDEWGWTGGAAQQDDAPAFGAEEEEEEDKKPRLQVTYSGFRIFDKTLFIVLEPTAALRAAKAHLFQAAAPTEKRQLSSTPNVGGRSASRSVGLGTPAPSFAGRAASVMSDVASDYGEEQEETEEGDSRNAAARGPLFRGTPSEWTPTPEPTRAPSVAFGRGDEEGSDEEQEVGLPRAPSVAPEREKEYAGAVGLAQKLLARTQGIDADDNGEIED